MSAAALPSSSSPTPEFRRHHAVEPPRVDASEFRQGWRVKTGLDGLLAAGAITPREWCAAVAFRGMHEKAMRSAVRVSKWGAVYTDPHCRQPRPEQTEAELDAVKQVRTVKAALGDVLFRLLEWSVIADLPWAEIARRLGGIDCRTARKWAAASIAALAAL